MKEQSVQIELTPEQKEQIKRATGTTGTEVAAVKLRLEPLEPRAAPRIALN